MPKKRRRKGRRAARPEPLGDGAGEERASAGILGQVKAAGVRLTRGGGVEEGGGGDEAETPTAHTGEDRHDAATDAQGMAEARAEWDRQSRTLSHLATFMWYLKTRHFKQLWDDPAPDSDDPRERRVLTRLEKGVEALQQGGVTIDDPTGWRYPDGGEGWMKPVQISPTPGIEFAVITETMKPIVYRDERLIQRGEVFVASPIIDDEEEIEAGRVPNETTEPVEESDDEPND